MKQNYLSKYNTGSAKPNVVKFSHNWNKKLDCQFFTTIRNTKSYPYYSQRELEIFQVMLNDEFYCRARLISVDVQRLDELTPALLVLDTGTKDWRELFRKFHVVDACTLLLFERII